MNNLVSRPAFPDFLIVGATRCGTSTLWNHLRQHPDIFMPSTKELNFFNKDNNYQSGIAHYQHFFRLKNKLIAGEASAGYFHGNVYKIDSNGVKTPITGDSIQRIKQHLPSVKLIFTLRNPVYRAYSQYTLKCLRGMETSDTLSQAILDEENGLRPVYSGEDFPYLHYNNYSFFIQKWLAHFPRKQLFFLNFEEWTTQPNLHLKRLYDFLGVDNSFASAVAVKNRGIAPRSKKISQVEYKMHQQFNAFKLAKGSLFRRLNQKAPATLSSYEYDTIRPYFEPSIQELQELIGINISSWEK